jgi:hypothetical protein
MRSAFTLRLLARKHRLLIHQQFGYLQVGANRSLLLVRSYAPLVVDAIRRLPPPVYVPGIGPWGAGYTQTLHSV